jgi:biotin carboxyl carrier protein
MANSPPASISGSIEATWREIDQVVDGIAQLAKTEESPRKFYAALLERLIAALVAQGGAIWSVAASGQLRQECLVSPPHPWLGEDGGDPPRHSDVIGLVLKSGQPRLIGPQRQASAADPVANPTAAMLILFPWCVDGAPVGLIELFQRADGGPQVQQGYLQFLEVIGELVAEFHRNGQLRDFRRLARDWTRFSQFAQQVHGTLDVRGTAYAIANEGRRLLECDRVSVLVRRGRRYRLTAVSGVEKPNRRAKLARRLERLCRAAVRLGEPLYFPADKDDRPPQVDELLSEYLDESHARSIAIVPVAADSAADGAAARRPIGVLVVETFFGTLGSRKQALLSEAGVHSGLALKNALELESIPFLRVFRGLGWMMGIRRLLKIAVVAGVLAAAVAAAVFVDTDFDVVAEGELQPALLRDVFARADGTIADLRVEHGQRVKAGELLAVLRRPQLDLEFKQVLGELQTAQQKLAALETERLQSTRDSEEQRRRYAQATAQKEELDATVSSLKAQLEILENKQKESEIRSPMDGEVLTWNVRQLLQDRPVSRGQILLTVGDLSGPWKLDLRLPDQRAGFVLAAREAQPDKPLDVAYLLVMDPRRRHTGTVARLGMRSEAAEGGAAFMPVTVDIDRTALEKPTPGAGVKASIHCGRRCWGYVWLHDLVDALRTWLFY